MKPKWKLRFGWYKRNGYKYLGLQQYMKKFQVSVHVAQHDINIMLDNDYIFLTRFTKSNQVYKINPFIRIK